MLCQLGHESLAETHNFPVGLALGVEVGTALAAAHGQCGQAVLEDLLKAQELDYGCVNGGVQSQTALVRTDCGVELYTITSVDLNLAVVVNPGYTEHDLTLRLYDSLKDASLNQVGSLFENGLKALEDFSYCLKKFAFSLVSFADLVIDTLHI